MKHLTLLLIILLPLTIAAQSFEYCTVNEHTNGKIVLLADSTLAPTEIAPNQYLDAGTTIEWLNVLGLYRWELVSVVLMELPGIGKQVHQYYFKRRKE